MTDQHPITPPFEVVREWCAHSDEHETYDQFWHHIATKAAQWGADQELDACCEWTQGYAECGDSLRLARRPEPPSLKESALESLEEIVKLAEMFVPLENIRKALEALPND